MTDCPIEKTESIIKRNAFGVLAVVLLTTLACASCMSEREYQLRSKDIALKGRHPATYSPLVLKGPVTVAEGAELAVTVPSQPYQPTDIPDGQSIQAGLVKDVLATTAIVGGAAYGIHEAKGSSKVTTTTTNAGTASAAAGN